MSRRDTWCNTAQAVYDAISQHVQQPVQGGECFLPLFIHIEAPPRMTYEEVMDSDADAMELSLQRIMTILTLLLVDPRDAPGNATPSPSQQPFGDVTFCADERVQVQTNKSKKKGDSTAEEVAEQLRRRRLRVAYHATEAVVVSAAKIVFENLDVAFDSFQPEQKQTSSQGATGVIIETSGSVTFRDCEVHVPFGLFSLVRGHGARLECSHNSTVHVDLPSVVVAPSTSHVPQLAGFGTVVDGGALSLSGSSVLLSASTLGPMMVPPLDAVIVVLPGGCVTTKDDCVIRWVDSERLVVRAAILALGGDVGETSTKEKKKTTTVSCSDTMFGVGWEAGLCCGLVQRSEPATDRRGCDCFCELVLERCAFVASVRGGCTTNGDGCAADGLGSGSHSSRGLSASSDRSTQGLKEELLPLWYTRQISKGDMQDVSSSSAPCGLLCCGEGVQCTLRGCSLSMSTASTLLLPRRRGNDAVALLSSTRKTCGGGTLPLPPDDEDVPLEWGIMCREKAIVSIAQSKCSVKRSAVVVDTGGKVTSASSVWRKHAGTSRGRGRALLGVITPLLMVDHSSMVTCDGDRFIGAGERGRPVDVEENSSDLNTSTTIDVRNGSTFICTHVVILESSPIGITVSGGAHLEMSNTTLTSEERERISSDRQTAFLRGPLPTTVGVMAVAYGSVVLKDVTVCDFHVGVSLNGGDCPLTVDTSSAPVVCFKESLLQSCVVSGSTFQHSVSCAFSIAKIPKLTAAGAAPVQLIDCGSTGNFVECFLSVDDCAIPVELKCSSNHNNNSNVLLYEELCRESLAIDADGVSQARLKMIAMVQTAAATASCAHEADSSSTKATSSVIACDGVAVACRGLGTRVSMSGGTVALCSEGIYVSEGATMDVSDAIFVFRERCGGVKQNEKEKERDTAHGGVKTSAGSSTAGGVMLECRINQDRDPSSSSSSSFTRCIVAGFECGFGMVLGPDTFTGAAVYERSAECVSPVMGVVAKITECSAVGCETGFMIGSCGASILPVAAHAPAVCGVALHQCRSIGCALQGFLDRHAAAGVDLLVTSSSSSAVVENERSCVSGLLSSVSDFLVS